MKSHHKICSIQVRLLTAALAFVILGGLGACSGFSKKPVMSVESANMLSTNALVTEADKSWNKKDYVSSELFYSRLLQRRDIPTQYILPSTRRLAISSFNSEHYHSARESLEKWAKLDTDVYNDPEWQDFYFKTLYKLNEIPFLQSYLEKNMENNSRPWAIRSKAGKRLSGIAPKDKALPILERLYTIAPNQNNRSELENWFRSYLEKSDKDNLNIISENVTSDNGLKFPYDLITFEKARRQSSMSDYWPASWRTMTSIVDEGQFADKTPLINIISGLEKEYGVPRIGLALILPISGRFQEYGWKIVRGAGAAQWELTKAGMDVDVKVINTEDKNWLKHLDELPAWYNVIGGPISVTAFKELEASQEYKKKATFAFLAKAGDLQEGMDAWRFFSSPDDQIKATLDLAIDDLGIKNLAILYPKEKFGRQMSSEFWKKAIQHGAKVTGMMSYPPNDIPAWGKIVAKLVKVPEKEARNKANGLDADAPLPDTDFGAVFIPDTWRQAQLMIPHFFFHEADTLVFLGPELWSQALNTSRGIEANNFRLAVCPGAWWPESGGAVKLKNVMNEEGLGIPDFWVALGYDFVRFSSKLGAIPSDWTPETINSRIMAAQNMDFSLAPIRWDSNGIAEQKLFLFRPREDGKSKVDSESIKKTLIKARAHHEMRIKAWKKQNQDNN
ncbi:penicillin-binding protein activator [Maridesulfovibrio bastinii]|uniref:penicillin-binding protein activator n=1 Tax=Maridesulfovibrio bastinii TaxID=47157 RepID=UPI0003FA662D|nr:penicillin-binding protein activator [Maridesulfovibrio bastinii]